MGTITQQQKNQETEKLRHEVLGLIMGRGNPDRLFRERVRDEFIKLMENN